MFCVYCGKEVKDTELYCNSCGKKVVRPETNDKTQEQISADDAKTNITDENANNQPLITEQNSDTETEAVKDREATNMSEDSSQNITNEETVSVENENEKGKDILAPIPDIIIEKISKKSTNRPRTKADKIVCAIFSVIFSLIIWSISLAVVCLLFVRLGFTENNLKAAINNIDFNELKTEHIIDIEKFSERFDTEIPEDSSFKEAIYHLIDQDELVNPITEKEVELLIERLDFESFIAKATAKSIDLLYKGEEKQAVYPKDIIEFLKENEETIETTIGIDILEVDYEYMHQYLEEHNDEYLNFHSNEHNENNIGDTTKDIIGFIFSDLFVGLSIALIAILTFAIGFINRKISSALKYSGVSIMASGILMLIPSVLYRIVMRFMDIVPYDFIADVISPITVVLAIVSAITTFIGILLLVIGILINKKKNIYIPNNT